MLPADLGCPGRVESLGDQELRKRWEKDEAENEKSRYTTGSNNFCRTLSPRVDIGFGSPTVQEAVQASKYLNSKYYKKSGGEEEDRTPDLCIANAALSQLSYFPESGRLAASTQRDANYKSSRSSVQTHRHA